MDRLVTEMLGAFGAFCLIPLAVVILGTVAIMLWSVVAGAFGPDDYHENVRRTFWRLVRKFYKRI
jgi:hypothetical protein